VGSLIVQGALVAPFVRRFGETIKVLRQKSAGRTILVFQPVMAGA